MTRLIEEVRPISRQRDEVKALRAVAGSLCLGSRASVDLTRQEPHQLFEARYHEPWSRISRMPAEL